MRRKVPPPAANSAEIQKKQWPWIITLASVIISALWIDRADDKKEIKRLNAIIVTYAYTNTKSAIKLGDSWEELFHILEAIQHDKDSIFHCTRRYDSAYCPDKPSGYSKYNGVR